MHNNHPYFSFISDSIIENNDVRIFHTITKPSSTISATDYESFSLDSISIQNSVDEATMSTFSHDKMNSDLKLDLRMYTYSSLKSRYTFIAK